MFEVNSETAKALYRAQAPRMRGRLRLDISSRSFPSDPTRPLDLDAARIAVGERFIRLLKGCAADASPLGRYSEHFAPNAVPMLDNPDGDLKVMPTPDSFEPFVVERLNTAFGLEPDGEGYARALDSLARDFFTWVIRAPEARETYLFTETDGHVQVRCSPPERYHPLNATGDHGAPPLR
jgi:hypothetical protein